MLPAEGKAPERDDLNVMRQIIVNRIDKSGVAEPQVVIQGKDRIIVEMPGVQNPDQIRDLVGTTGRLDFVPLGQNQMAQDQEVGGEVLATKCDDTDDRDVRPVLRRPGRRGGRSAPNQTGQRTVNFTLTGEGKDKFANYTADHIGDYFAIVLDGKVITAPVIKSSIPNGQVEIQSGGIGGYPLARTPRTSSRSSSSASCRSRSPSSPTRPSARPSARRSSRRA